MNKNKFIKFNVGMLAMILLLGGEVVPALAAKNRTANTKTVIYRLPAVGIRDFHTSYSVQTHQITFSGKASGVKNITVKYNGKIIKEAKIKKNDRKFKMTMPFAGYKTFKIYGDNQLLKTVSAKSYATRRPDVYFYAQNDTNLKISLRGKKGNIVVVWKNGKPIKHQRITNSSNTTIVVENTEFENKAKIKVTMRTLGKKTSKGVELGKMDDNSRVIVDSVADKKR